MRDGLEWRWLFAWVVNMKYAGDDCFTSKIEILVYFDAAWDKKITLWTFFFSKIT